MVCVLGPFYKEVGPPSKKGYPTRGSKHSPTLYANLLTKGHPRGRASFYGLRRVHFSLSFTDNKHFAYNGEQAAYCDATNFALVVNANCL